MQHTNQLDAAFISGKKRDKKERSDPNSYDYSSYFANIKKYFDESHIIAANIETTFPPPPFAGYPAFRSPKSLAEECFKSGINLFFAANNHSADAGTKGLKGTIEIYDSLGVDYTGIYESGEDEELLSPLLIEKEGFRIIFLNYTYGTNGIATPVPYIIKRLSEEEINRDIETAKKSLPDLICAAVHWGEEYSLTPSGNQIKWEKFLYSKGVDIIIGSHPHVPQNIAIYRDSTGTVKNITAYSLGNAISNMTAQNTRIAIMLGVTITRDTSGKIVISEPEKHLIWTARPSHSNKNYGILHIEDYLSNIEVTGKHNEHDLIIRYYNKFNK